MKTYIAQIMLAGSLLVPAMFAQTTTPPQKPPQNKVNARRQNQQDRIAQGVKSGQLSDKETAHLETKEHKLNQEIHTDRTANGGKLTSQERKQVNGQQNNLSNKIYDDKHNARDSAQVACPAHEGSLEAPFARYSLWFTNHRELVRRSLGVLYSLQRKSEWPRA